MLDLWIMAVVYVTIGLYVGTFAHSKNEELSGADLRKVIFVWPLVLARYIYELVRKN